jgi:hypothetical protein
MALESASEGVGVSKLALMILAPFVWAERAKIVGYPQRFAQEALGHNSKAVHRAYAKHALIKLPSLEEYEQKAAAKTTPAA